LLSNGNYCSLRSDVAAELECEAGQQLRLHPVGEPDRAAAYTIHEIHTGTPAVRIAKAGRERVGAAGPFEAVIDTTVPRSGKMLYSQIWERDDVWEGLWDEGQDHLIVCAPHGYIESNTAQAAGIVRKHLGPDRASGWFVRAFGEDAFDRWHITSTELSPAAYPGLSVVANRGFSHALSFHVHNESEIEVGGRASQAFRDRVAARIHEVIDRKREVVTDYEQMKHRGNSEENLVNWLTDNNDGVQIELTPVIARNYRKRIARAIADLYDGILPEPE
jgi:aromatic ring-cleaving dioxygenase